MATPSATSSASRLHLVKSVVFIAIFMTMIWLPLLDSCFQLDHTPPSNEKRAPAPLPELAPGVDGIRAFFTGLDRYYGDHFGFRNWLVWRQNRWKHKWFREPPLPEVIQGREGWYFYAGNQMIEHVTGHTRFDDERLRAWRDLLETRRDWLAERGIAYLFVVPPDKHTVYPEYLPDWLKPASTPTKLSQLLAYMKAHSTVPILDLRPTLIEAKNHARVYQFIDTHWTYSGGFATYQPLVRALAAQLPGIQPLDTNRFTLSYGTKIGGDLATLLGQEHLVEKDWVTFTPVPPLKGLADTVDTAVYPKAWPKGTDPRITENPDAAGTAILFRDSFAASWEPFLGYHFNRVIYIWDYHWNPEFIEREAPRVVIDEILERFLNQVDPVKLKAEDGLTPGAAATTAASYQ